MAARQLAHISCGASASSSTRVASGPRNGAVSSPPLAGRKHAPTSAIDRHILKCVSIFGRARAPLGASRQAITAAGGLPRGWGDGCAHAPISRLQRSASVMSHAWRALSQPPDLAAEGGVGMGGCGSQAVNRVPPRFFNVLIDVDQSKMAKHTFK